MTEEDYALYEETAKAEKAKEEAAYKKHLEVKKIKNRFESRVRDYFDEYSFVFIRDILLQPGYKILGEKIFLSLLGLYMGMYVGIAFVLGNICGFFVPLFYGFTVYLDQDHAMLAKCLGVIWVVTKFIKAFCTKKEKETTYEAMFYKPQKATDWYAIGRGMGFYVDLSIIIGLTYLVYGTGYGQMFHGVWVIVNIMIFSRNIPGVGGNSNLGLITLVFISGLVIILLPDIYSKLLKITVKTLEPVRMAEESIGVAAPIGGILGDFKNPFEPLFSLSSHSFVDALRSCTGNFISGWLIFDDWLGAGYALSTATTIRMRTGDAKLSGTAGLYSGLTVFWVLGDLFLSVRSGAVLRVILTLISIVSAACAWFTFGVKVWSGRGQGVMLTEARANFGFIFGNGPTGMRIAILRLCCFTGSVCFMCRTNANIAIGIFLMTITSFISERAMTIILGLLSMQPSLIMQGLTRVKPITESLQNATVDAYSSLGENSGSRTEPG